MQLQPLFLLEFMHCKTFLDEAAYQQRTSAFIFRDSFHKSSLSAKELGMPHFDQASLIS